MNAREWVRPWRGDGRKPKLSPADVQGLRAWASLGTSKAAVARRLGVNVKTVDRYIKGEHVRQYE